MIHILQGTILEDLQVLAHNHIGVSASQHCMLISSRSWTQFVRAQKVQSIWVDISFITLCLVPLFFQLKGKKNGLVQLYYFNYNCCKALPLLTF